MSAQSEKYGTERVEYFKFVFANKMNHDFQHNPKALFSLERVLDERFGELM